MICLKSSSYKKFITHRPNEKNIVELVNNVFAESPQRRVGIPTGGVHDKNTQKWLECSYCTIFLHVFLYVLLENFLCVLIVNTPCTRKGGFGIYESFRPSRRSHPI